MSSAETAAPLAPPAPARSAVPAAARPYYWSVRRELWENKSIWRAPLIMAGVVLLGLFLSHVSGSHVAWESDNEIGGMHVAPGFIAFAVATGVVTAAGFVVGVFYCLSAMHGERRDRSILFWKSLPVSDLATVLSKLTVPAVIIPAVTLVVATALQLIIAGVDTADMVSAGQDPVALWAQVGAGRLWLMYVYALVALSLWHLPAFGWLLLVSAWARKMPILWAFGVPIALSILERIAFNTHRVSDLFWDRLVGGLGEAFSIPAHSSMVEMRDMTPGVFITSPGLWLGLLVAAGFVAAAVWVRRRAEPI